MKETIKNSIVGGLVFSLVVVVIGVSYAAVSQATTGETLTAQMFNESIVPTGFVGAFNGTTCPLGWNKADGSGDEKDTLGNLTTLDLRGEFIRGYDDGRGIDIGRSLATFQIDDFKSHFHTTTTSYSYSTGLGGGGSPVARHGTSDNSDSKGGVETRPRNIALLYCIKD